MILGLDHDDPWDQRMCGTALKLLVRSSRRRKALLQLFLALGKRCTDGATARSYNGDQDRDRGRPVLFVRPVRVVPVTISSNLAILDFFCRRECDCIRFAKWLRGAARSALAAEGRRSAFFPADLI